MWNNAQCIKEVSGVHQMENSWWSQKNDNGGKWLFVDHYKNFSLYCVREEAIERFWAVEVYDLTYILIGSLAAVLRTDFEGQWKKQEDKLWGYPI